METERFQSVRGFRSFWEKSKREAAQRNLTFVQVEHGKGTKRSRRRRLAGKVATDVEQTVQPSSPQDSSRRLQVYQAQKRHRNRKTEYGETLKDEKAQLQHSIALTKAQTTQLSTDNKSIKALLSARGVDPSHHNSMSPTALEEKRSATSKEGDGVASESRTGEAVRGVIESAFHETSDPRVVECRALLLNDIEAYGSDEEQEKDAWIESADQIMNNG